MRASRCFVGSTTRSLNGRSCPWRLSRTRPYVEARRTDVRRSRDGSVAASAARNAATARIMKAKAKSIDYPLNETIFLRTRDPTVISPSASMISVWPVEVWYSGDMNPG